ncbi:PAS domain S-box protein [Rhodoferax sp.]|uniref:PAS domain S-box protein n=1 Tax=Rhodoferax sp. TaxID=50421 RepID=UPI00272665FB|nr:PAS domain S-box protein [Rhodoferax sp.]MDO8319606.1 PAS domain S-box protein [Rhodoferax sp.]
MTKNAASHRFTQLLRAMLLVTLALLSLNLIDYWGQHGQDIQTNMMGRQRMLTERIHRLLLQLDQANTGDATKPQRLLELDQAVKLFNDTLLGFAQGGGTQTSKGTAVLLSADPDPVSQANLQRTLNLWQPFASLLASINHNGQPEPEQVALALAFANRYSDSLLDLTEDLITQHTQTEAAPVDRLFWIDALACALMLALLAWAAWLKRKIEVQQQTDIAALNSHLSTKASAVKATKQQLTELLQSSPDLVFEKDQHGIYTQCNLPFAHYLGLTQEQIVGKTDFDLFPAADAERFRAHDRHTLAAEQGVTVEELQTQPRGTERRLLQVTKVPLSPAANQVAAIRGVIRDITEERANEIALYAAEQQRRLLEQCIAKLNDVVVITEAEPIDAPSPRIVFVNDAFERMTGYSRAEAIGQSPRLLQGTNSQRSELDRIRQALSHWQPVHAELLNYKKNGDEFWVELDIAPVANEQGWFTHWIAVQRDISERKNAESQMMQLINAAQDSARLKSEFLSAINHEMRTPMHGILGMSQLLLNTRLDPDQSLYAKHIASSANEYLRVMEKALDFSKLEAASLRIDRLPFELRPLLKGIEDLIRPKAQDKNLTLDCQLVTTLPQHFVGDALRLRQCLLLLLDNALKFTSNGGIRLMLSPVMQSGHAWLRFEVHDTGIGLSESDRERLFRPFVQVDGSLSRRFGGIGLGLVLCQQLVKLMQGRMGVDSTAGQGSNFWFELPLTEAA